MSDHPAPLLASLTPETIEMLRVMGERDMLSNGLADASGMLNLAIMQRDHAERSLHSLQSTLCVTSVRLAEVQAELTVAHKDLNQLHVELMESKTERDRLCLELMESKTERDQLRTELAEANAEREFLLGGITQTSYTDTARILNELTLSNEELQKENQTLSAKLLTAAPTIRALIAETKQLRETDTLQAATIQRLQTELGFHLVTPLD